MKNEDISILSLDLTYAGLSGGNLVVSPIMGVEGFDGQSDIARYVARAKTAEVGLSYDRKNPMMSRYYINSAKRIFVDSSLFVSKDTIVPLTKVVVVNYINDNGLNRKQLSHFQHKPPMHLQMVTDESGPWVAFDIERRDEAQKTSLLLLSNNPIYHSSPTWSGVDKDLHVKTIREISDKLPIEVAYLYIFLGVNGYSPQTAAVVFATGAKFIRQWMVGL